MTDPAVWLPAFRFLAQKTRVFGDALPWSRLQRGFEFDGRSVPLVRLCPRGREVLLRAAANGFGGTGP